MVQWTTIILIVVLSLMIGLAAKKLYRTAYFFHASLEDIKKIYAKITREFCQEVKFYNMKRSKYGLIQNSRNYFKCLSENIGACGIIKSDINPLLFIGSKLCSISLLNDLLIYLPKDEWINEEIDSLRDQRVDLNQEGDMNVFIQVGIAKYNISISITINQKGFIDIIF